ncbi:MULTISPECIES: hypothetical protein [Actinomyces]|uniref:hypothetical protein n=1 Tax=Actinomyces TaxID=1654 RepID=UPI0009301396|nr:MULTISPECIES: hypothetical protein [Actinomyces]
MIFLTGLAITSAAIAWLYLLVRKSLLLVAIVFHPSHCQDRRGTPRGVDQQMGDARGRADLFQARAGHDIPGRVRSGHRPNKSGTVLHQRPLGGVVLIAMATFTPYLTYRFISFVGLDM